MCASGTHCSVMKGMGWIVISCISQLFKTQYFHSLLFLWLSDQSPAEGAVAIQAQCLEFHFDERVLKIMCDAYSLLQDIFFNVLSRGKVISVYPGTLTALCRSSLLFYHT